MMTIISSFETGKAVFMTQAIDAAALPDRTKYLIFGIMAFGQFMALIDIQIVAACPNRHRWWAGKGCRHCRICFPQNPDWKPSFRVRRSGFPWILG